MSSRVPLKIAFHCWFLRVLSRLLLYSAWNVAPWVAAPSDIDTDAYRLWLAHRWRRYFTSHRWSICREIKVAWATATRVLYSSWSVAADFFLFLVLPIKSNGCSFILPSIGMSLNVRFLASIAHRLQFRWRGRVHACPSSSMFPSYEYSSLAL